MFFGSRWWGLWLDSNRQKPVTEERRRREGGGQREVAGGASNDDELWGTWFFLLRLRSADKHAR